MMNALQPALFRIVRLPLLSSFLVLFLLSPIARAQGVWEKVPIPDGEAVNDVVFVTDQVAVAVGSGGRILRSTDGGMSWNIVESGVQELLNDLFFSSEERGIIVGKHGRILRTTDGGLTWSRESYTAEFYLSNPYFIDDNHGWVVTSNLIRTTNGGTDWEYLPFSWEGALTDIYMHDRDTGYAVGPSGFAGVGEIFRTVDGGATWESVPVDGEVPVDRDYNAITFGDRSRGLVVGSGGEVIYSEDGGATWKPGLNASTSDLMKAVLHDDGTGYAAGLDGVIVRTTDGGRTWSTMRGGQPEALRGVASRGKVVLATGEQLPSPGRGFILRYSNEPSGIESTDARSLNRLRIVPNPATAGAGVTFHLKERGEVRLHIVDPLGQRVATLQEGNLEAGPHTFHPDIERLEAGTYFVRLESRGRREVCMMVVGR